MIEKDPKANDNKTALEDQWAVRINKNNFKRN